MRAAEIATPSAGPDSYLPVQSAPAAHFAQRVMPTMGSKLLGIIERFQADGGFHLTRPRTDVTITPAASEPWSRAVATAHPPSFPAWHPGPRWAAHQAQAAGSSVAQEIRDVLTWRQASRWGVAADQSMLTDCPVV